MKNLLLKGRDSRRKLATSLLMARSGQGRECAEPQLCCAFPSQDGPPLDKDPGDGLA
jgi:hypothetical protein